MKNPILELFKNLKDQPKEVTEHIAQARASEERAKADYQKLMQAYRNLIKEPGYSQIRNQAIQAMGVNLGLLLERGLQCPTCIVPASRVKSLQDIVVEPIEQVYLDSLSEQAEEQGKELEA